MYKQNYYDILGQIEMPTRYVGNEVNSVTKDPDNIDLNFALVFPDLYEIGTSHFGMQILYTILNNENNIWAQRFFTPAPDMEMLLKQKNIPCLSMESKDELKSFDIIGISLLYELNFTNILTMLKLSSIPFYAKDRDDSFPIIIGGGPCAFNPEPLADFFDVFVIGDGEEAILEISKTQILWKKQGDGKKATLLKMLSEINGVYIPSFFEHEFDDLGIQTIKPKYENYKTIKRAILPDLSNAIFPKSPIVPFGRPVHDRLRLEIARGCSKGCRFCQAGMIYRPVRERSVESLINIAEESVQTTGYSDISLLSLSTGDYSHLGPLMNGLLDLDTGYCNAISLPSIRAEKLTPELMQIIKKVRKTGFTIAPEAKSQRLRDIINKNLTEESIFSTVENAFELGWRNIKLYFMMGLPFETMEDTEAICNLATRLANANAKGNKKISVSIAPFIPKAHTPFERCSQISMELAKEKLEYLKQNLKHKKVKLKWQNPEMSLVEGVWSRGDRKLSALLVNAFEKGCRLDGWTDKFKFDLWQEAFNETGIDPEFYTSRERKENEILPWDHIDSGISKKYLKEEFQKALQKSATNDCRDTECTGCGICDFQTIQPVLHDDTPDIQTQEPFERMPVDQNDFIKLEVVFSKIGPARFFGHLELANIIERAIKRANIKVKYSQGFNPQMKLSFGNPLPLGMESEEESFYIDVLKGTKPNEVILLLNKEIPTGLKIEKCLLFAKKKNDDKNNLATYDITLKGYLIKKEDIQTFIEQSEYIVEEISRKNRKRSTDLRKATKTINFIDDHNIVMSLQQYNARTIRPAEILTKVFNLPENVIQTAKIIKKKINQDI